MKLDNLTRGNLLTNNGIENPSSEKDRYQRNFSDVPFVSRARGLALFATVSLSLQSFSYIYGIDISKWQEDGGDFEYMVSQGWEVVVIKASEGLEEDPKFQTLLQKAIDAGALIMVYHFFRSNVDGKAQAEKCLEVIEPLMSYQNKTVVWCDIETADSVSNSGRINRVKNFLDTIVAGGQEAGMYCSPYLWGQLMSPTPSWTNNFWLWNAHWTGASTYYPPQGWSTSKIIIWQIGYWDNFSWCPAVPGWEPDVDVDKCLFATRFEMEEALGIAYVNDPPTPDPTKIVLETRSNVPVYTEPSLFPEHIDDLPSGISVEIYGVSPFNGEVWFEHSLGWSRFYEQIQMVDEQ